MFNRLSVSGADDRVGRDNLDTLMHVLRSHLALSQDHQKSPANEPVVVLWVAYSTRARRMPPGLFSYFLCSLPRRADARTRERNKAWEFCEHVELTKSG